MFSWRTMIPLLFFIVVLGLPSAYAEGPVPEQKIVTRDDLLDVAKELTPPGCIHSMTADFCELSVAVEFRNEIAELLLQGKDKDQVIDELVEKYGKRILASPERAGFGLFAWILPGTGILAGGATLGFLLRKWARRVPTVEAPSPERRQAVTSREKEHIEAELKNWL